MTEEALTSTIRSFAILIVSTPLTYAQESADDAAASATPDASDVAPAFYLEGAIVDSVRSRVRKEAIDVQHAEWVDQPFVYRQSPAAPTSHADTSVAVTHRATAVQQMGERRSS